MQQKKKQATEARHCFPVSTVNVVGICLSESHIESLAEHLILFSTVATVWFWSKDEQNHH